MEDETGQRIARALESIATVLKGEPEGFATFMNERLRAIAAEQIEAVDRVAEQIELLRNAVTTLREIYESRGY